MCKLVVGKMGVQDNGFKVDKYSNSIMKKLLFLVCLGVVNLTYASDGLLVNYFSNTQMKTVDAIIAYYDDFVQSKTHFSIPIDEAYTLFMKERSAIVRQSGNMSALTPDFADKVSFLESLDRESLSAIFNVAGYFDYYNRQGGQLKTGQWESTVTAANLSLNLQGPYMHMLQELSEKNEFFRRYTESILQSGDIGPVNYAAIILDYAQIDFKKKEERLVVIINLLHLSE